MKPGRNEKVAAVVAADEAAIAVDTAEAVVVDAVDRRWRRTGGDRGGGGRGGYRRRDATGNFLSVRYLPLN